MIDRVVSVSAIEHLAAYLGRVAAARAEEAKIRLEARGTFKDFEDSLRPKVRVDGDIAVIPLEGFVTKGADAFELIGGALDLDDVSRMAGEAAADPDVKAAVLEINSPGGYVVGLPEARESIEALAEKKETAAFTSGVMASAAYELANGAGFIGASRSSVVGSVGTRISYLEFSRMAQNLGITNQVFKSGQFKDMFSAMRPPSEAEAGMMQGMVDDEAARFKSVVTGKRAVADDAMQGQVFTGAQGSENGMVDANLPNLGALLEVMRGEAG